MVSKYVLFAGQDFYPNGGMDDYEGSFDSLEDAQASVPEYQDWAEIAVWDNNELKKVWFYKGGYWHECECE